MISLVQRNWFTWFLSTKHPSCTLN